MVEALLIPAGFAIGVYSTLVGAGGGFLLIPFLLFFYDDPPVVVTTASLTVAFFNAFSGSIAYARQKRIDYRSGFLFIATTVPGAILGASATSFFPRDVFSLFFGIGLILVALDIAFFSSEQRDAAPALAIPGMLHRHLTDAAGRTYEYGYSRRVAVIANFLIGFVATLMGVGGGILRVPVFVQVLRIPPHIATATSQFVLAFAAATGVIVHLVRGSVPFHVTEVGLLTVGVVVGAQVGAWLAKRVRGRLLLRLLSVALAFVGMKLIIEAIQTRW